MTATMSLASLICLVKADRSVAKAKSPNRNCRCVSPDPRRRSSLHHLNPRRLSGRLVRRERHTKTPSAARRKSAWWGGRGDGHGTDTPVRGCVRGTIVTAPKTVKLTSPRILPGFYFGYGVRRLVAAFGFLDCDGFPK